ncbi:MAG: uracil-DNA glycosylase [Thermoplasmataceae archaeon]
MYSNIEEMNALIKNCIKCNLSLKRKNAVCGSGSKNPKIMIIGEAPGKTEDENGIPFSGRSGALLRKVMEEAGIDSKDVYITNTVRCRPHNNQKPKKTNLIACNGYLKFEVEFLKPNIIVPLGNTSLKAFSYISGTRFEPITKAIGQEIPWNQVIIIPQFHPAAILRDMKRLTVFEDVFKKIANRS